MLLITRVHSRRVLVLGAAGLVPAALVTLLFVHQPSIGDRRLYPMFRGSVALLGLGLALATLITWATAPERLHRSSLTGLAWAGVTTIVCIGPFLESTPRARLYALELDHGRVVWAYRGSGARPTMVGEDLVVTDVGTRALIGFDPHSGRERWRHSIEDAGTEPEVDRALAAGAFVPGADATATPAADPVPEQAGLSLVDGVLRRDAEDESWSLSLPDESVVDFAVVGDDAYVYAASTGISGLNTARVLRFDVHDHEIVWQKQLPPELTAARRDAAAIGANDDTVVVAGGERIAALDSGDGTVRWTDNVVTLGKSRGYALPGADQGVMLTDSMVFLSTTPAG